MIKLLEKNSPQTRLYSIEEFEKVMGIHWTDRLLFPDPRQLKKIERKSERVVCKKELDLRERWLGARFQKEIASGFLPPLSVRYIDPILEYGLFAEEEIQKGKFIGEYTGLIRKRTPRRDQKNNYCFEYSIGDWARNPFIIDAQRYGNLTRFMNHSEEGNVESISVFQGGVMHIVFIATKKIPKGEQLSYHYGDIFWKKRKGPKINGF